MIWSRAPKYFWDDCNELESSIRSNIAHDIYELDEEIPKIEIPGETSDISNFCKQDWLEWVIIRDETVSFPFNMLKLGIYLVSSMDIGLAPQRFLQRIDKCSTDQCIDH